MLCFYCLVCLQLSCVLCFHKPGSPWLASVFTGSLDAPKGSRASAAPRWPQAVSSVSIQTAHLWPEARKGVGLLAMEIQGPACLDLGLSRDTLLEQLPLSSHPCVQRGAPGTGTQPLNVRVVTAEAGIRAAKLRTAPREK